MKVVIAEKPSVGRSIAEVLGANEKKDGYMEGAGYYVTWAFGHLIELCSPDHYGWKAWNAETLPMMPTLFETQVKHVFNPKTKETKIDLGAQKQLKIIRTLFTDSDEIIVATDAGREGELIFRYIYQYIGVKKNIKRLWISSLTNEAIKNGFNNLKYGSEYDNLFHSAKARSESDWLVGMNGTRALSIGAGKGTFSVGRVQTPTLAMICARFIENRDFKSRLYYKNYLVLIKEGVKFRAISDDEYDSKEKAIAAANMSKSAQPALLNKVDSKQQTDSVPLLYDLTSLQQDANKHFGLSADETLNAAQSLYEKKYLTYPRTGSRYIGEDVFATVPALIEFVKKNNSYTKAANSLNGISFNKKSVNAAKVTDHHALLPTDVLPNGLERNETLIYDLVVTRFLQAFAEDCIKRVVNLNFTCAGGFTARGVTILKEGWRSIVTVNNQEKEDEKNDGLDNEDAVLPKNLTEGERLPVEEVLTEAKKTKPKPILTEGLLLKAMETAGKDIEDEELRDAMKEGGLGTPATRAAIIEGLLYRYYIVRQKKQLHPTEKGLAVYELVKDKAIGSPILTGGWEKKLHDVEKGKILVNSFLDEIKVYTCKLTEDLLKSGVGLSSVNLGKEIKESFICPKCKKGKLVDGEKNWWCSEYKNNKACTFSISKEISNARISTADVKALITSGKTKTKKFQNKQGKDYEGFLQLNGGEIKIAWENQKVKTT